MATADSTRQPPEQAFLDFPMRPPGDAQGVKAGRHHWYEVAGEIQGAFADIDRAMSGMQWSGDARRAFDGVWSQFSGHGTEAWQHAQEMGDHLLRLGNHIEDAQHEWDLAMAAMTASTAIGIGLTFVTFGVSDAVAESAATAAVGTMEAICAALGVVLDAAVQVLAAAMRVAVQLAVKLTLQFTINVAAQETANAVEGRGLGHVDLLQAAEFAGVSMVVPGAAGKLSIGGRQLLAGAPGAVVTGAATDAVIQGLEGVTEGKPFSVGEVLLSGALAAGGQKLGETLPGAARTQPRVVRQDDDFWTATDEKGRAKAHLTSDGRLVPANPAGKATPLQHIMGTDPVKADSPYASFRSVRQGAKRYGRTEIELRVVRLQADIAAGRLPGVELLVPEKVQAIIRSEIAAIRSLDTDAALVQDQQGIRDYVQSLDLSRAEAGKLLRRLLALSNSSRDGEYLVKGVLPPDYFIGPKPVRGFP